MPIQIFLIVDRPHDRVFTTPVMPTFFVQQILKRCGNEAFGIEIGGDRCVRFRIGCWSMCCNPYEALIGTNPPDYLTGFLFAWACVSCAE